MELKWLSKFEINQIQDLFSICFGNDDLSSDFFKWKYFENPVGNALVCGIFDNDRLIASGALLPEFFFFQNKSNVIYKCTDLMTDPKYRGQGLAKKLVEELTKKGLNESFLIYTICSKIATKSFLKAGWLHHDEMIYFFRLPFIPSKYEMQTGAIHFQDLNVVIDQLNLPFEENYSMHLKNMLKWRISNSKFKYGIYELKQENISQFVLFSMVKNIIQIVYFTDYSSRKMKNQLFRKMHNIGKPTKKKFIALLPRRTSLFFFFIKQGYITNLFSFGRMKSTMDLNIIQSNNKIMDVKGFANQIRMLNYDDI